MDEQLKQLIELRDAAEAAVVTLKAERQAITDKVKTEARKDFSDEEFAEFRAKTAAIKAESAKSDGHSEEIADLEAEIARSGRRDPEVAEVVRANAGGAVVTEPLTYERGNGASYFQDMAKRAMGEAGEDAVDRLTRHAVDVSTSKEIRKLAKVGTEYRNLDRNDGSGGYLVPPLWVMSELVELARAGRPYANLVVAKPLPPGTDSINVPKINTGTATAIQTGDNVAIQETDLTDTSISAPVKTIAGQQGIAIQALDQSPLAFDDVVFRDLALDYATKVDLQVISGLGSGNQVTGVRATSGIITIAATDVVSELSKSQTAWRKIGDAIQRVHTQRFAPPEVIVMHPRRWAAFETAIAADGRPLVITNGAAVNQFGEKANGVVSQQVVGFMHGLPVVTDPNLPTTLGAGTNEDVIHVLRASDLWLFESSLRTRALQETRATTLTVLFQVYGYLAFTAARQPKSIVEIGGTALTPPTFA